MQNYMLERLLERISLSTYLLSLLSAGKQIVIFVFYGKIGNKKYYVANRIDKNGNNRIEVSA